MKSSAGLHAKTLILILLMVLFGPLGDVLLRKGMKQLGAVPVGSPSALPDFFLRTFTSGMIWMGIGFLLLFFVSYLLVLSWADYSFVQPASATGYAVVSLLGYLILGEVVTSLRWAGVAVICVGVFLVGRTPPRTTETS